MIKHPRRSFVKKASLLCGVSLFASTAPQSLAALDHKTSNGFSQLFSSPASAARISRAYLDQVENAADSAAVLDADIAALDLAHGDALRCYLRRRIEADFAAGNTISLDGWVLSRTEVDACLLSQKG